MKFEHKSEHYTAGLIHGLTKEAFIGKAGNFIRGAFQTGTKAPGVRSFGNKLWRSAGGKGTNAITNTSRIGQNAWSQGSNAFQQSRAGGASFLDAAKSGMKSGQKSFNAMYRGLTPGMQEGVRYTSAAVGAGALAGGGMAVKKVM